MDQFSNKTESEREVESFLTACERKDSPSTSTDTEMKVRFTVNIIIIIIIY